MSLAKSIQEKSVKIGVVGLGYVGLPMAVTVAKKGYEVLGFEVSKYAIEHVNKGENYIGDVADEDLKQVVSAGKLSATADYQRMQEVNVVLIAVPTPLDLYHQPDTTYIEKSTKAMAAHLQEGTLVVLESTTYPGTTREIIVPELEKAGLKVGETVFIAFSPERVDPGNETYKTHNTPKVVGGMTPACNEVAKLFYESILDAPVALVSSPEVAEMEKIYENTFRNINIALANEMTVLCDRMGISIWEVVDAAKTKPYGFMAFYPGPGVGGHCIPIDPFYLTWKAREYDFHTRLIELAGEINIAMPEFVVQRAIRMLNKQGVAISRAKILLLGAAYKKDIQDMRESPIEGVITQLENYDADFEIHDPYVSEFHHEKNGKQYKTVAMGNLKKYDLIIIITDHSNIDYQKLADTGIAILDTRNASKGIKAKNIELL
ncbi:MAG: nucleotide sugar dehydrogenase [Candidatus Cloacimonetes bacterium]|nr:nucleotide sugar dehydrogenase [Candidatus Cloacimonadota bacterium]MDY0337833.1 nucleotide sugar dehydrogenase [Candidatus Cloacimonadaceae bacterium]MCB5269878.1 nucleotide sugar dehydrogenase [Candidatus Cloacimonadota bacterium]MCK9336169.1 nucleotide sugar dehydrogenase [Candidatus Cloacimonadota bacterium]MDD2544403.1 nucleotide sugar dehydrogenase [Candidatus Cloacimonadota bacterium]